MQTTTATPTAKPTEASLGSAEANPVSLTAKAVEMVRDAMTRENLTGYGIRVGVVGGGCSGFQYSMDFENAAKDGDQVYEQDGLKVYVDPMSSMYLLGVNIDYIVGLQGAGFKFNNPSAKNTCGCGQSFTY